MVISNSSIPVNDSPEIVEKKNSVLERSSFSSSSTKTISESPKKENLSLAPATTSTMTVDTGLPQVKSHRLSFTSSKRSFGSSKDETFFDSHHQWLQYESDQDDFYSVNGEFSPSIGNTPKCSFSSSEKYPRFHNPLFEEEKLRVSFSLTPAPRRKKLAELFRESIREERVHVNLEDLCENQSEDSKKSSGDDDDDNNSAELKLVTNEDSEKEKKKSLNDHHRCLPRLSSFKGSLMEKRKKKKKKKIHVK